MSISSTTSRFSFAGNGSTTVFSYSSRFLADGDLTVILRDSAGVETTQVITTDYTVSGAGDAGGGSVTMIVAPASGENLTIFGNPVLTQGTDWVENDPDPAEDKENAFDKITLIAQRSRDLVDRSVKLTDGFTATFNPDLPAVLTADSTIAIDPTGVKFVIGPTVDTINQASVDAAAAAASATAASNSATAAATSETNAASSATAAASSASAASTSETNAATSETNAATSETNAATSATNAATSETNAATSETNAATSETNAATSASNASTSETNAATSATNAATSETNAATSETNAAASAAAAAASSIDPREASLLENVGLTGAAASGDLTINLTQDDGSTPAALNVGAVRIAHLNSTLATGQSSINDVVAALSAVIPDTATLGYVNGDSARVHVFGIDNAGTEELAFAARRDFREDVLHTTVALSINSDAANVLYSTTARSNITIRYLGFIQVNSISVAGTWTAPDIIRVSQSEREVDITESEANTAITSYGVTAGQWGDLESLVLTHGTWEITGTVGFNANGVNADQLFSIGMHNVAGNVNPGADFKQRTIDFAFLATTGRWITLKTGPETIIVNTTETWYLKSNVGTTTNLDFASHFRSRRIIK